MLKVFIHILILVMLATQAYAVHDNKQNSFMVGPLTTSFLIQIESSNDDNFYIAELIDPKGTVWIKSSKPSSYNAVPSHLYSLLRSPYRHHSGSNGLTSLLFPNDAKSLVTSGLWKIKIESVKKNSQATFKIFIKQTKSHSARRHLELKTKFTRNFKHQSLARQAIKQTVRHYREVGINIAFTKNAHNTIRFISKEMIEDKVLQGYSHCLPGFNPSKKTSHCDLEIYTNQDASIDVDRLANVITHEIAHYLGLFHFDDEVYPFGYLYDPLSDTGDKSLYNFMYKKNDVDHHLEFSPQQIQVMKSHPDLNI